MGKVIDFNKPPDAETIKLFLLAGAIDDLIKHSVSDGMDVKDIMAVLANRLGELCGAIHKAGNEDVVNVCLDLIRKQYSSHFDSTEE